MFNFIFYGSEIHFDTTKSSINIVIIEIIKSTKSKVIFLKTHFQSDFYNSIDYL